MPRFSEKAKEVFNVIWYDTDINKAKKLQNGLNDPLDLMFTKLWIARDYLVFRRPTKFLEIMTELEDENKQLKDLFIQFLINYLFILYHCGFNILIVDKDQAHKYYDSNEQLYQNMKFKDEWEKYFIEGWYYYTKAFYKAKIKNQTSDAIKLQKMSIQSFSKLPQDAEYFSKYNHLNLGIYYLQDGHLIEAEKSFTKSLGICARYNNKMQFWLLGSLSWINFVKGDLEQAIEYNENAINVAKRFDDINGIYSSLYLKGKYLYEEGNYDEALYAFQESLKYRKRYGVPLEIFNGYFNIFHFYNLRFDVTKDKSFLTKAEQIFNDLQELSKTNSNNITIVNYTNYASSLILRHGSIRKKAHAIDIIEELLEIYPNNIGISLNLLELLFQDVMQSEDQDTLDQIDELMTRIGKIPLRNNPQAIFGFISQQILLAKYIYYIKSDISVALNILLNSIDHVKKFKLNNLLKMLNTEIQILEKELTKWDNVDLSVKERILKSELNKYLHQALNMTNIQLSID